MQNLLRLVEQWRRETPMPSDLLLANRIREYLQVAILKAIYQSKFSGALAFMGGTALRICYDCKRFSEDLDFALDRPTKGYAFPALIRIVRAGFSAQGYAVEVKAAEEKTVQKAFVKFAKVLHPLGLSHREGQKIHIKVEVDTRPIPVADRQLESFFVTKFGEIFPILKHRLETTFAGKLLAILNRPYAKGRDYYDLIWYLARKTPLDLAYLNDGLRSLGVAPFPDPATALRQVASAIAETRPEIILKDIGRFLEDPTEAQWLRNYEAVLRQLVRQYLA